MNYEDFINTYAPSLQLKDKKGELNLSKKEILDNINVSDLLNGPSVGIYTDQSVRSELCAIVVNLQTVHQMVEDYAAGKYTYEKRPYVYTPETLTFKGLFDVVQNLATRTK